MSGPTAEPKAEQPAFDPTAFLGKLKEIVSNNKSPAGGGKSWVGTIVIIAISLVGIAVWAWISQRRNRELAKLRHEAFVTKVKLAQDLVDNKIKVNDETVARSKVLVAEAQEKIRINDADTKAEEARYAADLRAIDSIRSWRDVDPGVR
jgi:FtsZ-interacting cell division protein ZipA